MFDQIYVYFWEFYAEVKGWKLSKENNSILNDFFIHVLWFNLAGS